jgi:hypothetical protein
MKRYRWWLLLLVVPAAVGATALYLPRDDKVLVPDVRNWRLLSGHVGFPAQPVFVYSGLLPRVSPLQEDAIYWELDPNRGDGSGHLVSQPVPAPGWITFAVIGDSTLPGNEVFLELPGENKRIRVLALTQPLCWRRVTMGLPGDWVGKPMRLVLKGGPRDEKNPLGVSNPRALASGSVFVSNLTALAVVPVCVLSLLLFFLPGLPLAARLAAGGLIAPSRIVVAAGIFGCLAGYLAFWAYFCHRVVGWCFDGLVLAGGAALLALCLRRGRPTRTLILSGDVLTPLTLTALVAVFYSSLALSVNLWVPFQFVPRLRFLEFVLMQDNVIPYFLADRLYQGLDPRQIMPEWQTSDRPPLQAGILLTQLPLGHLVGEPWPWSQVFACVVQCLWVPALWEFWQSAGLARRKAGLALLLVTVTGFMLVNSVFTWPKLISAALAVNAFSLALLPRGPDAAQPPARAGLWGLAAALAFLSHSGVAFTFIPFGVLLLLPRYFPGVLRLAVAAATALAVVVPWSLYQSLYEPPGNRLIREHLAGSSKTWQQGRSAWLNLADAYESLSPGEILDNKRANVEVLFRASENPGEDHYPWPPNGTPKPWPVDAASLRRCEFLCLFWAPELLNLGWIAAAWQWRRRPAALDPVLGIAAPALALASIPVWVLLMFGPGTTVVHQGSYATMLLLFASLAAWLAVLPGRLPYVVLVAQGVLFTITWLITSPANHLGLQNPFLIASAATSFALLRRVAAGESRTAKPAGAKADR